MRETRQMNVRREMIQAQTYGNRELIIVDIAGDGDYHFDAPRIKVYCHPERLGFGYARNQGFRVSFPP